MSTKIWQSLGVGVILLAQIVAALIWHSTPGAKEAISSTFLFRTVSCLFFVTLGLGLFKGEAWARKVFCLWGLCLLTSLVLSLSMLAVADQDSWAILWLGGALAVGMNGGLIYRFRGEPLVLDAWNGMQSNFASLKTGTIWRAFLESAGLSAYAIGLIFGVVLALVTGFIACQILFSSAERAAMDRLEAFVFMCMSVVPITMVMAALMRLAWFAAAIWMAAFLEFLILAKLASQFYAAGPTAYGDVIFMPWSMGILGFFIIALFRDGRRSMRLVEPNAGKVEET